MIDNTISCVQSNDSTCINEEYPSNQNTYFELPPNDDCNPTDCNPTDGLHLNTSLRNVNRKKRKHEKSVGECMAESLNRTEDEKLHILKNIQQAMNEIAKNIERKATAEERKAEAEERKAAAEERKAAAAENKAAALHEIAASLRNSITEAENQ
ncbi:uncharacterized protein LOC111641455 [Centruroides sculpturatus]|uniref:uncharacterized protein LOC111641455 n=1 Tax=Centruroides sculpturatus TaxID=218467 RepID=UPI000C6DA62C|nr:uncharacterized protein LOC111641455 [Centruroides sculpturatus]